MDATTEQSLVDEWHAWCAQQDLVCRSADDMENDDDDLTPYQRDYIAAFIRRWDACVKGA